MHTDRNLVEVPQVAPKKKGRRKKANLKIGTLNVNRLHTTAENETSFEKWVEVNATMKKEKITILAGQETHLDEQNTHMIHSALGKQLLVINSQLENNPRASVGVAFILNKDLVEMENIKWCDLIKGKVIAKRLTWKNNKVTTLVNIYAPNRRGNHQARQAFWEKISIELTRHSLSKPDLC